MDALNPDAIVFCLFKMPNIPGALIWVKEIQLGLSGGSALAAPMTNVGCVPPSDEIGTTGSDGGRMADPPAQHTLLSYYSYGRLCSEDFCMIESGSHILWVGRCS